MVFGATGSTGRRAVQHLALYAPKDLRWAIAGRNRESLERLNADVPILIADSTDPASLAAVVTRTRVVLNMAGPFRRLGDPVVAACIEHSVHYCDISGETARIRDLIDKQQEAAQQAGVKIVCFGGASSAPADLAVLLLERELDETLREATALVQMGSGSLNGGTIQSIREGVESGDVQRESDPFLLGPYDRQPTSIERDPVSMRWDRARRAWVMPSPLGLSDTRAIRFSSSLRGADIKVQEYLAFDGVTGVFRALSYRAKIKCMGLAFRTRPGRELLTRIAPPGHGPSERQVTDGRYRLQLSGTGASGRRSQVTMSFNGDPGNYVTALCAAEIAVALAVDGSKLPDTSGILTPSIAIGIGLVDRLVDAGMGLTPGRGRTDVA